MITWKKYFDAVYCLSLADNVGRRTELSAELRRVGITGKILHWKITVRNQFYKYIWLNPSFPSERWWLKHDGALCATLGHYEIMKECLALGYGRVLIIEDDIRFLKEVGDIETILKNMPDCDIVLFDKCIPISKEMYFRSLGKDKINDEFMDFSNVKLWSAACYSVTRKAMKTMTLAQERKFIPADHITNRVDNQGSVINEDGLTRAASIKNMAVQDLKYKDEPNKYDKVMYEEILELGDYNL